MCRMYLKISDYGILFVASMYPIPRVFLKSKAFPNEKYVLPTAAKGYKYIARK